MGMMLHDHLVDEGAMYGCGRSCDCCTDVGSTKNGKRNRQAARRTARRRERNAWRSEYSEYMS